MAEEKLAVEVAQIDGIQVNDVNFPKASEDEILQ